MPHIRIVSPSGAIDPQFISIARSRLLSWGFEVSEGRFVRGKYGRFAATDDDRIADLNAAFSDPLVDIILCARGGYGMQRIIDHIQPTDKTVVGFSDITELHQLMTIRGIPSLHGLMCKHLATLSEDSVPLNYWRMALEGKPLKYNLTGHSLNRCGEVCGTLIGGNLSVLYGLQRTPFQLLEGRQKDCHPILFIEDIAERHYHVDRMMQNLRMSGVLEQISGLIVGQFADCHDDEDMKETVYETIARAVDGYDYPVLFDFPAGHVDDNMPLWLGCPTTLTVGKDCSDTTSACCVQIVPTTLTLP